MKHHIQKPIFPALFVIIASVSSVKFAAADFLVERGKHAMLTVSVTVDGSVEKPQGHRDEVVKWSTKRSFEAKVEMVADKAESMSVSESFNGPSDATRAALEDIQKQAKACGEDKMCQMQVAMKLMNSPAINGAADAPARYQVWRAVDSDGAAIEATGSHKESLNTVFYTAARETTNCTYTAPKVSPELSKLDANAGDMWAKLNKQAIESSSRAFMVEVDSIDKTGVLNILSGLSVGSGNIECVQNIGSGPESSQHSKTETLLPTEGTKFPVKVTGTAKGDTVIASGSSTLKMIQKLNNLGVGFAVDVDAPLDVVVRWELKAL